MASDLTFVQYVTDQIAGDCGVTHKKMFGEYGLFSGGKMFGMVCDNRFLIKPTPGGRAFTGPIAEGEPYPGAKLCLLIEDQIEDREWISELVRITAKELPLPKPRKSKKKKRTS